MVVSYTLALISIEFASELKSRVSRTDSIAGFHRRVLISHRAPICERFRVQRVKFVYATFKTFDIGRDDDKNGFNKVRYGSMLLGRRTEGSWGLEEVVKGVESDGWRRGYTDDDQLQLDFGAVFLLAFRPPCPWFIGIRLAYLNLAA